MRQFANVLDRKRGPMNQETIEVASSQIAAQAASKSMYIGAGAAVIGGGLSFNEMLGIFGAIVGLAGFLLNWYYKHKHFKLAQDEAAAKMALYG